MIDYVNGYNGDDFHVIRNSQIFDCSRFFSSSSGITLSYKFEFLGITFIASSYEDIDFYTSSIRASTYTGGQMKLSQINLIVTASAGTTTESKKFKIHIHDNILNAWLSPKPLTLRSNLQNVKSNVFVKFDDGIVADITFYYDFIWERNISAPTFLEVGVDGRIYINSSATDYPTTFPHNYPDCYKLTLPSYLAYTPIILGSIIVESSGELTLKYGNESAVDENMNILILGDSFLYTQKSDFDCCVDSIIDQFQSNTSKPWNLFKDKINFWSYFLPSSDDCSRLHGLFIKIDATHYIRIESFIEVANNIILSLIEAQLGDLPGLRNSFAAVYPLLDTVIPWSLLTPPPPPPPPPAPAPTYLPNNEIILTKAPGSPPGYQGLFDRIGFPGSADYSTPWETRIAEWESFAGTTLFNAVGVQSLSSFTYHFWLLLYNRVYLGCPDSAYGVSYGQRNYEFSKQKFETKIYFNKFINSISYTAVSGATINIGSRFFNNIGDKNKDSNNIIMLAKPQKGQLNGENVRSPETGNVSFLIANNGPIVSENILHEIAPGNLVPDAIPSYSILDIDVRLVCIHEFSHNYLLDEYHNRNEVLPVNDDSYEVEFSRSNLQSFYSLYNGLGTVSYPSGYIPFPNNPNTIDSTKIKWRWPRIIKIGITSSDLVYLPFIDTYTISIANNNINPSIPFLGSFRVDDIVILRKRDLFESNTYPRFKITAIDTSGNYTLQYLDASIPFGSFPAGSIMIFPRWDGENFERLVEKDIEIRMAKQAFVFTDTNNPNLMKMPQKPTIANISSPPYVDPLSIIKHPLNISRIVGLWAGGGSHYFGVFHPAGFCQMRGRYLNTVDIADQDTVVQGNFFCPVCRYIIVDAVDPLQHPIIDNNYENIYPKY